MFRVVILVFCMQFFAGMASAQWVSSGSGIGERSGDQGLTSPDGQAQSIGYSSLEDMEAAATLGYGASATDASNWGHANNDNFDVDCQRLFGSNCEEVDASEFRPIVPQILTCLGLGFENLTEMETYVDTVDAYGGDETDAANCKAHDYAANEIDGQLCMMATNDNDNAPACRASLGVPFSSQQDCSDLDRDDYEAIAYNMAPEIIVPADWSPSAIPGTASPGDTVISVLRATDSEGDELTWSITAMDFELFSIDPTTGVVTLADNNEVPSKQPDSVSLTVQVSDGALSDNLTLQIALQDPNRPPQIILPADWSPSEIPGTVSPGDTVISILRATDPEGDELTWSITAMDFELFSIDPTTGVVTLADNNEVPSEQPDSVSLTVQVSDGALNDNLTLQIALQDPNRPPQIILPADWAPTIIAHDTQQGANLVSQLVATDPDGDALTWSISASDLDIFAINPQSGVLTLAREQGVAGLEQRPETISITVQVSDGHLTDEQALSIPLEAEKVNNPPEIIVPAGFAASDLNPYDNRASVGTLEGRDPDEDVLSWSLIGASPAIFTINAQTGALSHNGLGAGDSLACEAASQASASQVSGSAQTRGSASYGVVSTNANVVEDYTSNDFRSKKDNGKQTTNGKYHVFLERSGHRGGSFTTQARSATNYDVTNGTNIRVPALRSAKVNSNITPINSYLVYQNNAKVDFSNKEAVITFANPIVGVYFTDNGFDSTIDALGKPGALYSRMPKVDKLALEDGRDIAWVDPIDSRVLRFRSKTSNVGDFMRVLTTASNTSTSTSGGSDLSDGPDTCSATVTVQLSDGQATAEETLTLAFADPNRAPQVFTPTDWTPSTVSNANGTGDLVVSTLGATDPDGDILKWSLDGADANLFSIGSFDGKISLSQAYGDASSLPSNANVTVRVTDGRLSDTLALNIPIEKKQEETSMASNVGTNGNFQFVSEDVQNIFNQDYTIMARFFHGSTGYDKPSFSYKKFKWINQSPKETIFFWGGNAVAQKFLSGLSLHVVGDTLSLQLGSDFNYLETRAPIQRNRWHTVMFAVDADQRRKTKKHNWPVKMYLNGRRLGLNEFSFVTKNKGYKPIGTPEGSWPKQRNAQTGNVYVEANNLPVAAIGIAGTIRPGGHWSVKQRRHLPLRGSSFIHEVSIWQGDKSSVASAIYNNNRDVADYASTSVGKPRYSWKPGLLGQSKSEIHCGNMGNYWNYTNGRYTCLGTPAGEAVLEENKDWTCGWRCNPDPKNFVIERWKGTLTLANLANGANPKNGKSDYVGPTAGNGTYRLDGDMHLYSGGLTFETEVYQPTYRKRMTGIIIPVPQASATSCRSGVVTGGMPVHVWHQGGSSTGAYLSALKKWKGWSSNCTTYNDDDIKAFATRAMSGKTKPLN